MTQSVPENVWISVEDRLPNSGDNVLLALTHDFVISGHWSELDDCWGSSNGFVIDETPSHWMIPPGLPDG